MDKDKICALCDAIDEATKECESITGLFASTAFHLRELTSGIAKYTEAIRAEVEKSEPLPEMPEV